MSIARHHAEWLSLVPVSGPFLSLPVLMEAFNTGLEPHDPDLSRLLRQEYANWQDSFEKRKADPVPHQNWIKLVLTKVLELDDPVLTEGQAIQQTLQAEVPEHHEFLRPSIVVIDPTTKKPRLLVQTYPRSQELTSYVVNSRWKASPDTRMTELLHATGVRLGLVTNGEHWMLVDAPKGETTGYSSWYASLWLEEPITLRAFRGLLSASRFFNVPDDQTLEALFTKSASNQQEVTDQLGYQVRRAVEVLIHSLDKADQDFGRELLAKVEPEKLYESALTVMMRLVFLFCAEERELIPSKPFPVYEQNYSVSTISKQLRELADQHGEELLERRYDAWPRLLAAFRAVYGGLRHDDVHIPAYGGSLFNPDRFPFLEGRQRGTSWRDTEANPLPVNNRTVLHLLEALQLLQIRMPGGGPAEARRLSFRALDIEQIGHVYEGLLDHTAKRAAEPFLGLMGTREKEPEIPLAELEKLRAKGEADLVTFVEKETSRSAQTIRNDLQVAASGSSQLDLAHLPSVLQKFKSVISLLSDFARVKTADPQKPVPEAIANRVEELEAALNECLSRGDPVSVVTARHILEMLRKIRSEESTGTKKRKKTSSSQSRLADDQFFVRVRTACQGDESLYQRVKPFAGLVRFDNFGYPVVIPKGSVFVTAGTDRRSSGTHYTPRSLTEPIVQYTLEPLVFIGPAEGKPKNEWKLKSAKELLDLKICDMACGSGAFLVQAARYMAERLMEAWDDATKANPQTPGITPEGTASTGKANEALIPDDPGERKTYALRIIAQRCLYGVDKNPLAAEMAKLSLWLLTVAKDKPFEFLDHSIRCGDSVVGISNIEQLRKFDLQPNAPGTIEFPGEFDEPVNEAMELRRQITEMQGNSVEIVEAQERMLRDANEKMERLKCAANMLIGAEFLRWDQHELIKEELEDEERSESDDENWQPSWLKAKKETVQFRRAARNRAWKNVVGHFKDSDLDFFRSECSMWVNGQTPFHWPLEFPEVLVERGGFNAFVGNPPFRSGSRISSDSSNAYLGFIKTAFPTSLGNTDLVCYFLLRADDLAHPDTGCLGFIATNSISQGDNRSSTLLPLMTHSRLHFAFPNMLWPGSASLFVSLVGFARTEFYEGKCNLYGRIVTGIDANLEETQSQGEPYTLAENAELGFKGVEFLGDGFKLPQEVGKVLYDKYQKQGIVRPWLNGADVTESVVLPERFAIDFADMSHEGASRYADCFEIIQRTVKPVRENDNRAARRERWWQYGEKAMGMRKALEGYETAFVRPFTSDTYFFDSVSTSFLFTNALIVVVTDDYAIFAVLSSCFHEAWSRNYGSSLKMDFRYTPSKCLETFPFPIHLKGRRLLALTETASVGQRYQELRRKLIDLSQEGITPIYNRFHDPDKTDAEIKKLRELHVEMDRAVAAAYGWSDLELGHDFHETKRGVRFTVSEPARREVLQRLLKLNHERYAEEEKQGLHRKKVAAKKAAPKKKTTSTPAREESTLFDGEDDE